jgi:hypothetical protein
MICPQVEDELGVTGASGVDIPTGVHTASETDVRFTHNPVASPG